MAGETLRKRPFVVVKEEDINVLQIERIFKHYDERILELDKRTNIDTIAEELSDTFAFSLPTLIAGGVSAAKRITPLDSPYSIQSLDHKIFCNTSTGAITVNLLAGLNGREVVIYNTTSSYDVTIAPKGTDLLDGAGSNKIMGKGVIVLTFQTTEGWW